MSSSELKAKLNFIKWQELYLKEKPFQIFIDIPEDAVDQRTTNLVFESVEVPVRDVRTAPETFSLDANGFVFRTHTTGVDEFTNNDIVEKHYLPEIEEVLRAEVKDIDRIFFFDWRLRKKAPNIEGSLLDLNDKTAWLRPATHVHIDQSPSAALNRIQLQMGSDAAFLLKGRVRIINVWRPLISSIEDWPLAVCDGGTVNKSDFVETDHVRRHYTGSTMYLRHNPAQRFYYMSKQGKDSILIFKQFDSQRDIPGQFAPHGSFRCLDHLDAEPRQSIEVRALVFNYAERKIHTPLNAELAGPNPDREIYGE